MTALDVIYEILNNYENKKTEIITDGRALIVRDDSPGPVKCRMMPFGVLRILSVDNLLILSIERHDVSGRQFKAIKVWIGNKKYKTYAISKGEITSLYILDKDDVLDVIHFKKKDDLFLAKHGKEISRLSKKP